MGSASLVLKAIRETGEPIRLTPAFDMQQAVIGATLWHPKADPPWVGIFSYLRTDRIRFWIQAEGRT